MVELYLMASHGYPPGILFPQDQGSRVVKEFYPYFSNQGAKLDGISLHSNMCNLRRNQCEKTWKPVTGYSEPEHLVKFNQAAGSSLIVNAQEGFPDSVLLGFGIADKCTRHERILQLLASKSDEWEKDGIDLSLVSKLVRLQPLSIDRHQPSEVSLLHPCWEIDSQKPLLDFIGGMVHNSEITVKPDGHVLIRGSEAEIRDVITLVAEFYLSRNSLNRRSLSFLVPPFNWSLTNEAPGVVILSPPLLSTTVAPQKSVEKSKLKASPKRKNSKKVAKERDLYRRNYFHACESLLSLMIGKKSHGRMAIHSLKRSGTELPELLTQFSAAIAGTGIAVLFSIACKFACGRVSLCASRLLSTGFGFGLVWLSWAVNQLRDTVLYISRNANKLDIKEEEMIRRMDKSVNDIYFRAATLLAVVALKFA